MQEQGNFLAAEGQYARALQKWAHAISLTPERSVLHELKAQASELLTSTVRLSKALGSRYHQ